ncbi:ULP_PROTEASE domain-containing protein [Raphanus sativus]|nr:ULP_PROTEASE domain-containing protein [Raphanus sativus]
MARTRSIRNKQQDEEDSDVEDVKALFPSVSLHNAESAGLTVTDVRNAEHDAELLVESMMEVSGDREERWGVWDEDRYDKQVENMLRLLGERHGFSKSDWGGGNVRLMLFVFKEGGTKTKRKVDDVELSDVEPEPKQQRMSEFYEHEAAKFGESQGHMEIQMEEMRLEIKNLKSITEKQGRFLEKMKSILKGRSGLYTRSAYVVHMDNHVVSTKPTTGRPSHDVITLVK